MAPNGMNKMCLLFYIEFCMGKGLKFFKYCGIKKRSLNYLKSDQFKANRTQETCFSAID